MEAKCGHALRGQLVSQKDLAKEIGCRPTTISMWNRDDRFLAWETAQTRKHRPAKLEAALLAILQKAIQGSSKHGDLVLRLLELEAEKTAIPEGREGVPAATVQVGVAFYGLPTPPTAADAERLRPPSGSAVIVST